LVSLAGKEVIISHIPVRLPVSSNLEDGAREPGVLIVGRMHEERGVNEWMSILDRVFTTHRELPIDIVGDGPLYGQVRNWKETNNYKSVRLHGYLNPHELENLYQQKTLFLSSAQHEGFGLALYEAAAHSMVVVARRNPGIDDAKQLIGNSLYAFDSVESAHQIISDLLGNKTLSRNAKIVCQLIRESNQKSLDELLKSWSIPSKTSNY
jgi:glycosyltransferase involved in cell wall biosynthesis